MTVLPGEGLPEPRPELEYGDFCAQFRELGDQHAKLQELEQSTAEILSAINTLATTNPDHYQRFTAEWLDWTDAF